MSPAWLGDPGPAGCSLAEAFELDRTRKRVELERVRGMERAIAAALSRAAGEELKRRERELDDE